MIMVRRLGQREVGRRELEALRDACQARELLPRTTSFCLSTSEGDAGLGQGSFGSCSGHQRVASGADTPGHRDIERFSRGQPLALDSDAFFGGKGSVVGRLHITDEIEAANNTIKLGAVKLSLRDTNAGSTLTTKIDLLRQREGRLGSIEATKLVPSIKVFHLDTEFGIGPRTSLPSAAESSVYAGAGGT